MDKLVEKEAPAPERRSVRRRLVQSTLFRQKSPEVESNGAEQKADKDCEVECDNEEDPENCCGSQGKKTRKRKGKGTPPATKASKKVKEKSPGNITPKKKGKSSRDYTPKKNGSCNGKASSNLLESEEASPPIPNLRLEAKLTAEENLRIFAGKQVHPFFSSWKSAKRNQEMTEVDNNGCSFDRKDKRITIGPIHVFDRIQDEAVPIDWGDLTFCDKTFTITNCPARTISSAFEGSVESLKFDKLLCDLHIPDALLSQDKESSDQCHIKEESIEASTEVSVMLVDNQEANCQLLDGSYEEHQLIKSKLPEHADSLRKYCAEEKSGVLPERKMLYHNGCGNQSDDSLWTDKYRPKNAMEVCGNNESVKFMSEWLHLWCQRGSQANKDYLVSDKCKMQDDCLDYVDSDSENIDEGDGMKNVLLVTGPVGSGKSAAIHACAIEKGFKVLENNASDCRLGTVVKQKFGEALESHCLERSLGNPLDLQNKSTVEFEMPSNGEVVHQVDDEGIEVIHTSDHVIPDEVFGTSEKFVCKEKAVNDRTDVKPLILFEDVDLFFPEDRGFIAAIQQIAEKAKGPVILTSNCDNIILPDNLDRLEASFTLPSPKDLLSHLHMICAAEKVEIEHHLLEQLIACCQADIRKTIMHLQFWCQNKRYGKGKIMQKLCDPMFFDAEAAHCILPKIIPWDFPSQLSELFEKEITRSLSLMEEKSTLREVVESEGHKGMMSSQDMHSNETDTVEAKKESMLRRNCSVQTSNEFVDPLGTACEFSSFPGTPVSLSRRNIRRKVNIVTSSDSEDDIFCDRSLIIADRDTNKELILDDCSRLPSHFSNVRNCKNPLTDNILHPEAEKLEESHYQCPQIENHVYLNGTCKSVDISCVPESSFVPETEIDNGAELISGTVCSGCVAETVEFSVGNGFDLNIAPVEVDNEYALMLHRNSDMLENMCDDIMEPSCREEVEDSQNERPAAVSQGYQVMDECSRIDFMERSKAIGKLNSCVAVDFVRESWKKLRGGNADIKQYATLEKANASQVVKLTNGMCKLISEADLLVSKCQTPDLLELSMFPCEESDVFSWCDEHLQMTSTLAQHGFCFYAKNASTIGSNLDSNRMKDFTWDMSCTTNMKAFGKSIGQNVDTSRILHGGSVLEVNPPKTEIFLESEVNLKLFNTIKSIVPKRSYLALKGDAFHEYLSSLGCISRSETSRLSKVIDTTKRQRVRGARHYLSAGALSLSPEDISLLGQSNIYGKNSSQTKDDSLG